MKIDHLTPNSAVLSELGSRLARVRKQQGLSQVRLAQDAGIGVATLRRIEAGQDSQMESWVKIIKALRLSQALDALLPESFESPMLEALRERNRAKRKAISNDSIKWGDEQS